MEYFAMKLSASSTFIKNYEMNRAERYYFI